MEKNQEAFSEERMKNKIIVNNNITESKWRTFSEIQNHNHHHH